MHKRSDGKIHSAKTDWSAVLYLLLGGVIVAFQLGKVSPNLPLILTEFNMSRVSAGVFVSIFSLIGVGIGTFAGGILSRVSVNMITFCAFSILIISGIVAAFSQTLSVIFLCRVLEGMCFVAIVVTYPTYISRITAPKDRAIAMSMWSVFIPLGFCLSILSSIVLSHFETWRYVWLVGSAFSIIYLFGAFLSPLLNNSILQHSQHTSIDYRSIFSNKNFIKLSLLFTVYAFQWITIMAWFPMFLIEQFELNSSSSAICTLLIILVNIPGNLLGGRLNKIYLRPSEILRIATVIMFSCIIGIFGVKFSPVISVFCAIVFSFFAGMVPATLFATVPIFSSSITQLGGANGMLFQGSALGQLIGSPIVAVFVTYGNGKWEYAVIPLLLLSIMQFLLSSSLRSTGH